MCKRSFVRAVNATVSRKQTQLWRARTSMDWKSTATRDGYVATKLWANGVEVSNVWAFCLPLVKLHECTTLLPYRDKHVDALRSSFLNLAAMHWIFNSRGLSIYLEYGAWFTMNTKLMNKISNHVITLAISGFSLHQLAKVTACFPKVTITTWD